MSFAGIENWNQFVYGCMKKFVLFSIVQNVISQTFVINSLVLFMSFAQSKSTHSKLQR